MKDVCAGHSIKEYTGLRLKMYNILGTSGSNIKYAKGVKKNVVKMKYDMNNIKNVYSLTKYSNIV